MTPILCIDPSVWVPSLAAIIAACITAAVSFVILNKQIHNSSKETKKDRSNIVATNKYQCRLQQLNELENSGIEVINAINPHKLYDLEMVASLGNSQVISFINSWGG